MSTKKMCDKCKASPSDTYQTECEYCGGTSFSYIQVESKVVLKGLLDEKAPPVDNYNPSIMDGLLDTSFLMYTTRKLASFTYQVALFVVSLIVLANLILLIWVILNETTTLTIFLGVVLLIVFFLLMTLIWLASLRLRLESFTALVQIAKNTHAGESK